MVVAETRTILKVARTYDGAGAVRDDRHATCDRDDDPSSVERRAVTTRWRRSILDERVAVRRMRRKRYEDKYLDILDKSLSRASNVNRESVVREDVGTSEGEVYTELYPGRSSNATSMRHREAWLTVC